MKAHTNKFPRATASSSSPPARKHSQTFSLCALNSLPDPFPFPRGQPAAFALHSQFRATSLDSCPLGFRCPYPLIARSRWQGSPTQILRVGPSLIFDDTFPLTLTSQVLQLLQVVLRLFRRRIFAASSVFRASVPRVPPPYQLASCLQFDVPPGFARDHKVL